MIQIFVNLSPIWNDQVAKMTNSEAEAEKLIREMNALPYFITDYMSYVEFVLVPISGQSILPKDTFLYEKLYKTVADDS